MVHARKQNNFEFQIVSNSMFGFGAKFGLLSSCGKTDSEQHFPMYSGLVSLSWFLRCDSPFLVICANAPK